MKKLDKPVPPKEYMIVSDSIPSGASMLLRGTSELLDPPLDPAVTGIRRICSLYSENIKKTHCEICSLFQTDIISAPNAVSCWNNSSSKQHWTKMRSSPLRFVRTNKDKEVKFRISADLRTSAN